MSLYDEIRTDHAEIRDALKILHDPGNRTTRQRGRDFLRLWRLVISHQAAEERVLYTPLLENDHTSGIASEAVEEHRVARTVLTDLDRTAPGDEQWTARLKVLTDLLDHHFGEEEGSLLEAAEALFTDEQVQDMTKAFAREKKRAAPSLKEHEAAGAKGSST